MKRHFLGNSQMGICVYEKAIQNVDDIKLAVTESIDSCLDEKLQWRQALVGYNTLMPEYRSCWDCKLNPEAVMSLGGNCNKFKKGYNDVVMSIGSCVEHYSQSYGLDMSYMEAVNFVKYGVGEHFDVHSDHGFSYICTVSTVAYLNDDYEGGELWFKHLDQTIKPEAGDIVVFPSTFIYAHASLPVRSGIKYSAVTMFDYNDKAHKN